MDKHATLLHPALGRLPARRILDCVFALSPQGGILHHHAEECSVGEQAGTVVYTITGQPPAPGRERCQIIAPLVPEFDAPQ